MRSSWMQIPFSAQCQADLYVILVRRAAYMQLRLRKMQLYTLLKVGFCMFGMYVCKYMLKWCACLISCHYLSTHIKLRNTILGRKKIMKPSDNHSTAISMAADFAQAAESHEAIA